MSEENIEELVATEAAYADATKDDPYPLGTVFTRGEPRRSTVYSVRLSSKEVEQVQQAAQEAHLPAATLVRSWIKDRLEQPGIDELRLRVLIHEEVRNAVQEALRTRAS